MNKFKVLILLTLIFSWSPHAQASFKHIPQGASLEVLQEAQLGQSLIFERKYQEAQQHFHKLWRKYPNSPLGTFGLMALYNAIMFENYDFSLEKSFEQVSDANEKIVAKIVQGQNATAWDNFLCGASAGLRGFYFIRQDKALTAFGQAGIADKCLKRAIKQDPKFKDTLLGQGMSLYWRSVFTQSFKALPFFKDHRPEGIRLMKASIQEGIVANELARVALMFVYLQGRKPAQGLKLTNTLLKTYPQNIIARLHQGRFYLSMGKPRQALATFNKILQDNPKISIAWFFKGRAQYFLRQKPAAKASFEKFLSLHHNPAWQAYAQYQLGTLAIQAGDRKQAYEHFKAGNKVYGRYKPNLKMILKMRQEKSKNK